MQGRRTILALSLTLALVLGVLAGSGLFTFVAANGTSYLSNDPAVCVNCHIMQEQYDGWVHGSHHAVAGCNDCHLPHDNVIHKLFIKASNGYHHSKAFTLMNFQEPIRIKPGNAEVLEANCIRCHGDMVNELTALEKWRKGDRQRRELHGLPRPPGGPADPGRSHRPGPPGTAGAADAPGGGEGPAEVGPGIRAWRGGA